VVQLAERATKICKFYFESLADEYPKDLRLIYVEVGWLKVILEGLSLLSPADPSERAALQALHDGPVQQCRNAIEELVKIFPSDPSASATGSKRKRAAKGQAMLAALAWPLKQSTAKRLLGEIAHYKATISMGLQGQLL
jgi:hypothetical protein